MAPNVIEEKVDMINNRISPIKDKDIEKYKDKIYTRDLFTRD